MAPRHLSRSEFLRRLALGTLTVPILAEAACGSSSPTSPSSTSSTTPGTGTATTPPTSGTTCTATPPVPEGPFYKDEKLNRSNIVETRQGVKIVYQFLVQNASCQPISGAIVDIWQADKDGVYSDFSSQGSLGQTFLRGYQVTDASGRCAFTSIFPGWYSGRLTHLHGKLQVNGVINPTTNFFFPKTVETDVYNSALYRGRGQNNTSVAQDVELRGDTARYNALMMNVTGDVASGYVATYTLTFGG